MTYRDYTALPDNGKRYEVLDGELCEMTGPNTRHQRVSRNIGVALHAHVTTHGLGEILFAPLDVILSDISIVQPDIVFMERQSVDAVVSFRGIEGPPTLAVEVLSPSSVTHDRVRKLDLYRRHGLVFFWIVDPEARTLEAFRLEGARYVLAGTLSADAPAALPPLPDLVLDPATIWA
jgi:Uma2 family endonuclease